MTVVKVGGSLYDLPDLGERLRTTLAALGDDDLLLVPGGGAAADLVRTLDRHNGLGEETSHVLALRALTFTAHVVAALVSPWKEGVVVADAAEAAKAWRDGAVAVLDVFAFAADDERRPDSLPHLWTVTSDSLAARAAHVFGARDLVLLKSVTIPEGVDWREAARQGIVDPMFPRVAEGLTVRGVNVRIS